MHLQVAQELSRGTVFMELSLTTTKAQIKWKEAVLITSSCYPASISRNDYTEELSITDGLRTKDQAWDLQKSTVILGQVAVTLTINILGDYLTFLYQ
jgi:hypothetical protein